MNANILSASCTLTPFPAIGIAGGVNIYAYSRNQSANLVDHMGLAAAGCLCPDGSDPVKDDDGTECCKDDIKTVDGKKKCCGDSRDRTEKQNKECKDLKNQIDQTQSAYETLNLGPQWSAADQMADIGVNYTMTVSDLRNQLVQKDISSAGSKGLGVTTGSVGLLAFGAGATFGGPPAWASIIMAGVGVGKTGYDAKGLNDAMNSMAADTASRDRAVQDYNAAQMTKALTSNMSLATKSYNDALNQMNKDREEKCCKAKQ